MEQALFLTHHIPLLDDGVQVNRERVNIDEVPDAIQTQNCDYDSFKMKAGTMQTPY